MKLSIEQKQLLVGKLVELEEFNIELILRTLEEKGLIESFVDSAGEIRYKSTKKGEQYLRKHGLI